MVFVFSPLYMRYNSYIFNLGRRFTRIYTDLFELGTVLKLCVLGALRGDKSLYF